MTTSVASVRSKDNIKTKDCKRKLRRKRKNREMNVMGTKGLTTDEKDDPSTYIISINKNRDGLLKL